MSIALITGGNRGIGYETARLLGEAGATVLVGARDQERGWQAEQRLRGEGWDARHVPLDVTDEESIAAAAKWITDEYDHLDILVNNAGIPGFDGSGRPSETTLATLRRVYETNVFSVVGVTNAMLPLLRRAEAARIVNVSSDVGSFTHISDPQHLLWPIVSAAYPSSKSALNMVTVMYAKELRETPIKVNAANPGYCATDFNGHSGFRSAREGAEVCAHLATLPPDGPTGVLWGFRWTEGTSGTYDVLPW